MKQRARLIWYAAAGVGGILLQLLNGAVTAGWILLTGLKKPDGLSLPVTPEEWILTVFLLLILSPFAEEYLFRGLIYGFLRGKWGKWAAGITVTVFFIACHRSLTGIPAYLIFALAAWFLREKTDSVGVCIALHVCYNMCALALSFMM